MRKFLVIVVVFFVGLSLMAQELSDGDKFLNVGVGIGNLVRPSGFKTNIPPIVFQYEQVVKEEFTVGGYFGFAKASFIDEGTFTLPYSPYSTELHEYKWKSTQIMIGLKGTYHFGSYLNLPEGMDAYGGVMLGYTVVTEKLEQLQGSVSLNPYLDPALKNRVLFGVLVGVRYSLSDSMAAFGELGYSTSILQLGLSYNLP